MAKRRVTLIGVPLDLGAGRRGVDMGPSAFRVAEVDAKIAQLGHDVDDWGDLHVKIHETQGPGDPRLKYLKEILEVCEALRDRVGEALEAGSTPVVLGGDHSVAMGTIAGLARHLPPAEGEARPRLVRRARRREHRRHQPDRQHPRDAARGRARPRRTLAREPRGLLADGGRLAGRRSSASGTWTSRSGRTCGRPASVPSPCATSTSGGCGR